jgi:hypothetical protein
LISCFIKLYEEVYIHDNYELESIL